MSSSPPRGNWEKHVSWPRSPAERNRERVAFQVKKEGLLRDLKQAQADKVEAEKKASDFKVKVQKETIQALKVHARIQGLGARKSTKIPS